MSSPGIELEYRVGLGRSLAESKAPPAHPHHGTEFAVGEINAPASAIDDAGQSTGFALTTKGEAHAFLHRNGAMVDLGPSGATSWGKAINASGQVAGQATPSGGSSYALVYSGTQ